MTNVSAELCLLMRVVVWQRKNVRQEDIKRRIEELIEVWVEFNQDRITYKIGLTSYNHILRGMKGSLRISLVKQINSCSQLGCGM